MSLKHVYFKGVEAPKVKLPPPSRRILAGDAFPQIKKVAPELVKIDPFAVWLLEKIRLDAHAYRASALMRRLPACFRQLRVPDGGAAIALLERKPELLPKVINTILIGVTEFFRDKQVFRFLEAELFPALLKERESIRICSAGVSDGHEMYSVAMLLGELSALHRSHLVGMDCRLSAVERAKTGWFEAKAMETLEPHLKEKYFEPQGAGFVARAALRGKIHWRVEDLFSFSKNESWDVILFRNVAIYFNDASAMKVWNHLGVQLNDGGYVITGKAERPPDAAPLRRVAACVYQKTGK